MVLSPPPPPPHTPRLKILCCFMFLCTCAKKNLNYVEGVGSCWINLSVVQSLKWSNLFMTLIKRAFSQLMLIIVSCCVSCRFFLEKAVESSSSFAKDKCKAMLTKVCLSYILLILKNVQTMLRSGMHDSVRYKVGQRKT